MQVYALNSDQYFVCASLAVVRQSARAKTTANVVEFGSVLKSNIGLLSERCASASTAIRDSCRESQAHELEVRTPPEVYTILCGNAYIYIRNQDGSCKG